jgi:hypothetical protein
MTGQTSTVSRNTLLGIYLNDHLAGATGGMELARRLHGAHRDDVISEQIATLVRQITEDRESLLALMRRLGVIVDPMKVAFGWIVEKAGRLKLNGRLTKRSPLSDLIELEALWLGVQGKAAGWRSLRALTTGDNRLDAAELDTLLDRAQYQLDMLETLRAATAARVLVDDADRPATS